MAENIWHLRRQIASPRFGEYHLLFFSNIMKDTQIHILADSNEQEVVQQVQVILLSVAKYLGYIDTPYRTRIRIIGHGKISKFEVNYMQYVSDTDTWICIRHGFFSKYGLSM